MGDMSTQWVGQLSEVLLLVMVGGGGALKPLKCEVGVDDQIPLVSFYCLCPSLIMEELIWKQSHK